jgi:hypothetical protein
MQDTEAQLGTTLDHSAMSSPTTAFAVGNHGVITRFDGTNWNTQVTSDGVTPYELNTIIAFSPTDAWAFGNFGAVLRYDGSPWRLFSRSG